MTTFTYAPTDADVPLGCRRKVAGYCDGRFPASLRFTDGVQNACPSCVTRLVQLGEAVVDPADAASDALPDELAEALEGQGRQVLAALVAVLTESDDAREALADALKDGRYEADDRRKLVTA